MTAQTTVDVSEVLRGLDADMARLGAEMSKAMRQIGDAMESLAKDSAPEITGVLKTSITHDVVSDGQGITVSVGSNVHYAPYVEYGTGDAGQWSGGASHHGIVDPSITYTSGWPGMRAQHPLRTAVYDHTALYRHYIEQAVRRSIK